MEIRIDMSELSKNSNGRLDDGGIGNGQEESFDLARALRRRLIAQYEERKVLEHEDSTKEEVARLAKETAKAKEWATKETFGEHVPLKKGRVVSRLIKALIDSECLTEVDKLMIIAVALETDATIKEVKRKGGIVTFWKYAKHNGEIYEKPGLNIELGKKWIASRTVDLFKMSGQWRQQDTEALVQEVMNSIDKLCEANEFIITDEKGEVFRASMPLLKRSSGDLFEPSAFFAFTPEYYDTMDFAALSGGWRKMGEPYLNMRLRLGANKPQLSRVGTKPIEFSLDDLTRQDGKPISKAAERMRRMRARRKAAEIVEYIETTEGTGDAKIEVVGDSVRMSTTKQPTKKPGRKRKRKEPGN